MIDIITNLRAFIIADTTLTANLSTYNSQKAVFTRRPVPESAAFPFIVISPLIAATENDYVDRLQRTHTYDIAVYGSNDTATKYRTVEETAFLLLNKFARLTNAEFSMPTGYHLTQATATGPIPFPVDDLNTIARGVTVNFTIMKEN